MTGWWVTSLCPTISTISRSDFPYLTRLTVASRCIMRELTPPVVSVVQFSVGTGCAVYDQLLYLDSFR
jgi:hypothetical protein